ncbi:CRISPR-associated helicase Cas3' [Caldanaerobius polysaccharolyticus]|uniref:CRISPR-associated helicase Cas3' n=1 Tax=Caldanaerobius polysaccharolyticus TaxID=44256 RepID=UPI00047BC461|nr:CRISPR-associated helicase Cas3' [Caldanaerobius polysaccharolyticus]
MDIAKRHEYNDKVFFQTLKGHTVDGLVILKRYFDSNEMTVREFCRKWDVDYNRFVQNTFEIVLFHDTGKLIKEFQENIRMGKSSKDYPHPLISVYIVMMLQEAGMDILRPLDDKYCPFPDEEFMALCQILSHHTQLYQGIYENVSNVPHLLYDEINRFLDDIPEIIRLSGFKGITIKPVHVKNEPIPKDFIDEFRHIKNQWVDFCRNMKAKDKVRLKAVYSYMYSLLQLCDDYSSAYFSEYVEEHNLDWDITGPILSYDAAGKYVIPYPEIDKNAITGGRDPRDFQKRLGDVGPYVMLLAPCGRGKTEGALYWAENMRKHRFINRLIFAMPTQITSNAMADRLKMIYGEENVGVYHGKSLLYYQEQLKGIIDEDDLKLIELAEEQNFMSKVFLKPIMVTTIDHLVFSFIHGFSQADFTLGNIQTACIVFDEVHYYEKDTLRHLVSLFSLLREMKIPHLLMSGTFPEFLKKNLEESAALEGKSYETVIDEEGLKYQPFIVKKHGDCIVNKIENDFAVNDDVIEEIRSNYHKGIRQYIILNTVRKAQEVYKRLKGVIEPSDNLVLYHSRFTGHDRSKKDKSLLRDRDKRPYILVSTQAIEISLDISCDVMFTELAPADAIGQRGGRLNRGAKHYLKDNLECVLHLYNTDTMRPYVNSKKDEDVKAVLERTYAGFTDKPYTYGDIKAICDIAYRDFRLDYTDFLAFFYAGTLFGYSYKEITREGAGEEGNVFKLRSDDYIMIDAYPLDVVGDNVENCRDYENIVKVPYWWYVSAKENLFKNLEDKYHKYLVCKLPYSFEIGFDESKLKEVMPDYGAFL